jgi:hypothetical protein
MGSGTEEYRGYTIHWDTLYSRSREWKARAGIISPLDNSKVGADIQTITGDRFKSEAEAADYILQMAAQWVDQRLEGLESDLGLGFRSTVLNGSSEKKESEDAQNHSTKQVR